MLAVCKTTRGMHASNCIRGEPLCLGTAQNNHAWCENSLKLAHANDHKNDIPIGLVHSYFTSLLYFLYWQNRSCKTIFVFWPDTCVGFHSRFLPSVHSWILSVRVAWTSERIFSMSLKVKTSSLVSCSNVVAIKPCLRDTSCLSSAAWDWRSPVSSSHHNNFFWIL